MAEDKPGRTAGYEETKKLLSRGSRGTARRAARAADRRSPSEEKNERPDRQEADGS